MSGTERARRADAQRNRTAILSAAEQEFRAHGMGASMDGIAQRAEVGVGTLYRNYPTKEALLRDVMAAKLQPLAAVARELADAEDPGRAFFTFMRRVADESASFKALADRLAASGFDIKSLHRDVGSDLMTALGELLRRAQRAGGVRDDITAKDVLMLMASVGHVEAIAQSRAARSRCITLLCDAMRTPGSDVAPPRGAARPRGRRG